MINLLEMLRVPLGIALLIGAASLFAVYTYGKFAKQALGPASKALEVEEGKTRLDRAMAKLAAQKDGLGLTRDGLSLFISNLDAFAARAIAARMAERSLDLMYYIWDDDLTGRLLLNEVLLAADRGVRVRLLLDDINAQGRDPAYVALDQHPNIEIRMFNPSRTRRNGLRRGLEMVLRALTVTRRMHNKAFIADGRIAFVGGRNIGDSYFGAGQTSNFRDLDLMLVGSSVGNVENIFDSFWNSEVALPIHALTLPGTLKNPDKWRKRLSSFYMTDEAKPFLAYLKEHSNIEHFLDTTSKLFPAHDVKVLSDPPEKALKRQSQNWLMGQLMPLMQKARTSLQLTSPYFVPGTAGTGHLTEMAERGCDVKILTNSLAATDVAAVHGGYMCYRKKLLKGGVRLFELKAEGATHRLRLFGSGRASLHTKAFLVDESVGFVGSFNFDPRSASLNTEMGILFECPEISSMMNMLFCDEIAGGMSYRVTLNDKSKLTWNSIEDEKPASTLHEPESRWWRRVFVRIVSWLPIESQL